MVATLVERAFSQNSIVIIIYLIKIPFGIIIG
nr:MAG TPA: hypothetical protein [Bacteriophage sp.]